MVPRTIEGLIGIALYPLLHGDVEHLAANSAPAFVLVFLLHANYGKLTWPVLGWGWFLSGLWLWVAARDGNHIGFSGVIYALASFLFFSGFIRRYYRLMAVSLIIVFLYGYMVWGVLPIKPGVSWEGHLFGMMAGAILAAYYRKEGPQRPKYSWEDESDEDDEYVQPDDETPPEYSSTSYTKPPTWDGR